MRNKQLIVKEVYAKTILSASKVHEYTVNPYIGCEHGCTYCYARFMKRYTGHKEEWGKFVDVKVNASRLLQHEITKKRRGRVWISGVCDPYQPLEKKYELTKRCLRIFSTYRWPVTIQTKSSLVQRDLALLSNLKDVEVGLSITSGNEHLREIFEPHAPPIKERIETLQVLHLESIKTFAMIAPLLPKAEQLATQLADKVDYVLVDKMNYHYADWVYRENALEYAMEKAFFIRKRKEISEAFKQEDVPCHFLF